MCKAWAELHAAAYSTSPASLRATNPGGRATIDGRAGGAAGQDAAGRRAVQERRSQDGDAESGDAESGDAQHRAAERGAQDRSRADERGGGAGAQEEDGAPSQEAAQE